MIQTQVRLQLFVRQQLASDGTKRFLKTRQALFTNRQTRPLPIKPNVTGTPAAGFEVSTVAVEPLLLSVEGDADQLAGLTSIDTAPISVSIEWLSSYGGRPGTSKRSRTRRRM